jgi:hypothetical protein
MAELSLSTAITNDDDSVIFKCKEGTMRSLLKSLMLLSLLVGLPAPCLAEDLPPFQIVYRQENVTTGEVSTSSNLLLTVINRSGAEARDVVVSAVNNNSYFVINIPLSFGNLPDGQQKELLIPSDVPNLFISEENEEVVWQIEYSAGAGEPTTIEIVGDKG